MHDPAAPLDLLIPALNDNSADAAIASLAINAENRALVDFTAPYYMTPGRFVMRRDTTLGAATPEALEDRLIAVVSDSAHEAYLKAFFPKSRLAPFENAALARIALKTGRVNALFGDAISSSFWLNGANSGRMLRVQGRALRRCALFWRRGGHRREEGLQSVAPRARLRSGSARSPRNLRGALPEIFSDQPILSSRSVIHTIYHGRSGLTCLS